MIDVAPPLTEMVNRANSQHTAGKDARPVRQRVSFLHAVRCKHNTAVFGHGREVLPQHAFGCGVEAAGRLVEKEDRGITDDGDGEGELAFIAAGELLREPVSVGRQSEGTDEGFDVVGGVADAAYASVEGELLGYCEGIARVKLRADAEVRAGSSAMGED